MMHLIATFLAVLVLTVSASADDFVCSAAVKHVACPAADKMPPAPPLPSNYSDLMFVVVFERGEAHCRVGCTEAMQAIGVGLARIRNRELRSVIVRAFTSPTPFGAGSPPPPLAFYCVDVLVPDDRRLHDYQWRLRAARACNLAVLGLYGDVTEFVSAVRQGRLRLEVDLPGSSPSAEIRYVR